MDKYVVLRLLDNGELEIKQSKRTRLRIGSWADGFGLYTIVGRKKAPTTFQYFSLMTPDRVETSSPALKRFISGIPDTVRVAVQPFHGFGQIMLIHWAARWKEAYDLLFSNPNLLWLVTIGIFEGRISSKEIHLLLGEKQRVILGKIALHEASGAHLNLLRKIRVDSGSLSEGRTLIDLLSRRDLLSALRHRDTVPTSLLGLLCRRPDLAQHELMPVLCGWAENVSFDDFRLNYELRGLSSIPPAEHYGDIQRIAKALKIDQPAQAIAQCRSADDMQKLHDRWMHRLARATRRPVGNDRFPPPPLPDSQSIKAIRTPSALGTEAKEMSHCVNSYTTAAASGECYMYRVLAPERATLEIRRLGDGKLEPRAVETRA